MACNEILARTGNIHAAQRSLERRSRMLLRGLLELGEPFAREIIAVQCAGGKGLERMHRVNGTAQRLRHGRSVPQDLGIEEEGLREAVARIDGGENLGAHVSLA